MLMQAQNSTAMLAGTVVCLCAHCGIKTSICTLLAHTREWVIAAGAVNKKLPGTKPSVRPGAVRVAPDAAMRATAPEYRGIWNSLKKIYFESGWKGNDAMPAAPP
jgi:hypothetical protein